VKQVNRCSGAFKEQILSVKV